MTMELRIYSHSRRHDIKSVTNTPIYHQVDCCHLEPPRPDLCGDHTGLEPKTAESFWSVPANERYYQENITYIGKILDELKGQGKKVGIDVFCMAGRHRSVAMAERLEWGCRKRFEGNGVTVAGTKHFEIPIELQEKTKREREEAWAKEERAAEQQQGPLDWQTGIDQQEARNRQRAPAQQRGRPQHRHRDNQRHRPPQQFRHPSPNRPIPGPIGLQLLSQVQIPVRFHVPGQAPTRGQVEVPVRHVSLREARITSQEQSWLRQRAVHTSNPNNQAFHRQRSLFPPPGLVDVIRGLDGTVERDGYDSIGTRRLRARNRAGAQGRSRQATNNSVGGSLLAYLMRSFAI